MITFKNVIYQYESTPMHFDFHINKAEQVNIIGASGAGKSTLLHLIAGFITPASGQILLNQQDFTHKSANKRPVSMLFQDNNLFTHLTVKQNLALGIAANLKLDASKEQELMRITDRIGLLDYLNVYPDKLSGGQKQRVAIGRCLLQRRPILLLDEPFSSLDPKLKKEMFMLLDEISREYHLTVLMVTHQLDDINADHARCLLIDQGKIIYDGNFDLIKNNQEAASKIGL